MKGSVLALREFEPADLVLDPTDYAAIRSRYAGRIDATPSDLPGAYRVSCRGYVGRVGLPSGTVLVIEPKLPVANLFYMLCSDAGLAQFHPPPLGLRRHADLFAFLLAALVARAEDLLARGLYADYVPQQADLPLVRGRILLGPQLARYGELKHSHMCSFAHLTADNPENRVVAATIRYLPALLRRDRQEEADLARRVRALVSRFEGVRPLSRREALVALKGIRLHRLNLAYGPVLGLCGLVLNHLTLDSVSGAHPFASFLVDMARLFESFVASRLTAMLPSFGLRAVVQRHDYLDEERQVRIRPDLLVYSRGGTVPLLVLDTKYKVVDGPAAGLNEDIYQVNAYLDRYSLRHGVLVYPQFRSQNAARFRLQGTPRQMHVLSLDLSLPDAAGLERECMMLAGRLAALTRER